LGSEGCEPFVAVCDSEAIKSSDDVKLRIVLCLAKSFQGFLDQRDRVAVLNSHSIQTAVVNAEAETTPWLLNKCKGAMG
jgi:hypothetical protein